MFAISIDKTKKATTPERVAAHILAIYDLIPDVISVHRPRNISPRELDHCLPWACFDGASLAGGKCKGGTVLYLNKNYFFKLQSGLGRGTNNYTELLSLKLVLLFATEKGCRQLQIFRDSLVIINWFNESPDVTCTH